MEIRPKKRDFQRLLDIKSKHYGRLGLFFFGCMYLAETGALLFPPNEKVLKQVRDAIEEKNKKKARSMTAKQKEEQDMAHINLLVNFICSTEPLELYKIDIRDAKCFTALTRFCSYIRDLYLLVPHFDSILSDQKGFISTFFLLESIEIRLLEKGFSAVGYWTAKTEEKKRDSKRVQKSVAAKKAKKDEMKQCVLEAYHRGDIPLGLRPHTVAKRIQTYVRREGRKKPGSLDTIKRYLKEEGIF